MLLQWGMPRRLFWPNTSLRYRLYEAKQFPAAHGTPRRMRTAASAATFAQANYLHLFNIRWPRAAAKSRNSMAEAMTTLTLALASRRRGPVGATCVTRLR